MNVIILIILQLMLLTRHTHTESCSAYGEVREVKEGKKKIPQVCDHTGTSLEWFQVCKSGWDMEEAHVWCRQLGYLEAKNKGVGFTKPKNNQTPKLANLNCDSETDTRIVDCDNINYIGNCELVADVKCNKCERDTQCTASSYCDSVSGKCVKPCVTTCPENSHCIMIGGCVVVEYTVPTTTPATPSETPTTTSVTELHTISSPTRIVPTDLLTTTLSTELPTDTPIGGSVRTTDTVEVTTSHNATTESTQLAATRGPTEHYSMTFSQILILSVCILVVFACIVPTCGVALSSCYLYKIRQRKKVTIQQNYYEEMAPIPSCSSQEYNNSVSVPIYTPIHYDSVNGDNVSYSTARSLCESFAADDRPYYSTVGEIARVEHCYYSTDTAIDSTDRQIPYYSTVGDAVPVQEPARYYSTDTATDGTDRQIPYYSTVGDAVPVQEPARYSTAGDDTATQMPYYSTINDDTTTNGQIPYYTTVEDIETADGETAGSYYSTLTDATAMNENELYESIDGEFRYREYVNVDGNIPIEPYLVT